MAGMDKLRLSMALISKPDRRNCQTAGEANPEV